MPDKKLTDSEIIKALEYLVKCNNNVNNCDRCSLSILFPRCPEKIGKLALDLINRLQEENEKWQGGYMTQKQEIANLEIELKAMRGAANSYKAENERLEELIDVRHKVFETKCEELEIAKAEAYKEFAEKLKEKLVYEHFFETEVVFLDKIKIDNLLKELVIKNDIGRYDSYTDTFVKKMVGE